MQDGVQGLLTIKQDVDSLAEALKKVLRDEDLASSLGREAKMLMEKELNWSRIAAQIIDLYRQIII